MRSAKKYSLAAIASLLLISSTAHADISLHTAQACTKHLPKIERAYQIPSHWLSAIASTESGRYHSKLRLAVPWPWTINVEGKGYWFKTKDEAVRAVKKHQSQGKRSIDVGCMQVNLRYHGENFKNVSQALNPMHNIAYAAKFLRKNYSNYKSWRKATAAYHSKTPSKGRSYYKRVYKRWEQVVERLKESSTEITKRPPSKTNSGQLQLATAADSKVSGKQASQAQVKSVRMPNNNFVASRKVPTPPKSRAKLTPLKAKKVDTPEPREAQTNAPRQQLAKNSKSQMFIKVTPKAKPANAPIKLTASRSKTADPLLSGKQPATAPAPFLKPDPEKITPKQLAAIEKIEKAAKVSSPTARNLGRGKPVHKNTPPSSLKQKTKAKAIDSKTLRDAAARSLRVSKPSPKNKPVTTADSSPFIF